MIQMENEVGLLGDTRDRCKEAEEAFAAPVPQELMDYLQKNKATLLPETRKLWDSTGDKASGTWEQVFGKGNGTDEAFMAWHYATYMNHVTEMGKKEYPVPVYVNAWLVQPQDKKPGDYPSGGPQAHNHDFWRAGAPQIDILSPGHLPDQLRRDRHDVQPQRQPAVYPRDARRCRQRLLRLRPAQCADVLAVRHRDARCRR